MAELVGGALLSAFLQVLFDRLASGDFLDLFKGNKPIEKLLQQFETKLQSARVLLKDADEKQLTDEDVRKWLHDLQKVIFRADELTDKIDYEVLRRKLEGASISSTFSRRDLEGASISSTFSRRDLEGASISSTFSRRNLEGASISSTFSYMFDIAVKHEIKDILDELEQLIADKPIEKLLQRFETKLQSANVLLKDAEEKQLTDEDVRKWLHDLKEVIIRAEDLTSELKERLKVKKGLRRKPELPSRRSRMFAKFDESDEDEIEDSLDEDLIAHEDEIEDSFDEDLITHEDEIEDILNNLEQLIAHKDELGSKELTEIRVSEGWHGAPLSIKSQVYGGEDDKEAIIKSVVSDDSYGDNIPLVVPIVSRGGIRKATLAELVFNDQRVKDHFQIKAWVTVSDVLTITKKVFTGSTHRSSLLRNFELDFLQEKLRKELEELKNELEGKTFLLVLDNVWSEDYHFWDELRRPFTSGASGSKIIITTRSSIVASTSKVEAHSLRELSNDSCWKLFIQHAFENEDLSAHPDRRKIGEEIVKKCNGLPLAVKSVAALLRSVSSLDEWRMILENGIWDLKLQENASKYVLPALWLSYQYLSPKLKRCFAYCSIFPKDYEFTKKEVILLWMAEGFLQPEGGTRMEDVGKEYFMTLTSRSCFQQSVHDKSKFTMHDWHDLATFVLGDFGFRLEDDSMHNISHKTRHLSFMKEKVGDMRYIYRARHLRTFLPLESNKPFRDAVPLEQLLTEKKCLRVLSLSLYPCIAELPNSILESKSLRYLDLSSTSIRNIPDTICILYNLETLLLSNCANLTRLPSEIRRLIKLRHLDFTGSPIKELPPRICELTDLQTLTRFIVCKEHSRIEELGDLQQLHGEFEICGLENVVDVEKVSVAKMLEKKFLTSLGLYWDGESCDGTLKEREKILDLLQPREDLKALRIYGFAGERFPDWMGNQSFGNIVEVQLSECKNCMLLPPLGQLPSLKNLQISGFKSVVTIGEEFYSDSSSTTEPFKFLEVLRFEDMAMWKGGLFTKDRNFPNLKELVFSECPKLDVWLPDCFPLLTKLLVSRCRQLMPLLKPTSHQRNEFSSLEELKIFACPEQVIFLQEGLPSSLKKIRISRCRSLEFLHYKNFQHLTSLESLEIIECKELRRLPEELPTTPFKLSIVECPFLESGGW